MRFIETDIKLPFLHTCICHALILLPALLAVFDSASKTSSVRLNYDTCMYT